MNSFKLRKLAQMSKTLTAFSLVLSAQLAKADIVGECIAKIKNEFARTSYGIDEKGKFELRNTRVEIVNDVPGETNAQQVVSTALVVEAIKDSAHRYTFLVKKDLCLPESNVNLEGLVRLKVAEHYATVTTELYGNSQSTQFRGLNRTVESKKEIEKRYLEEKLRFDPEAKMAQQQLKIFATKVNQQYIANGLAIKEENLPESNSVFETLASRFKDSVKSADATIGFGSLWQNPDPASITTGTRVELRGIVDTLAFLFGEKNLPDFWKERVLLETGSDVTLFNDGNTSVSQITTVKFKVGDSYLFARDTLTKFSEKDSTNCNGSTHCDKFDYQSVGFRWNARDPLKYRSNVYFEFDLIKINGNKPFEADVIRQTSASNPHWPLLRRLRPPEKDNPGLLLGYIVKTGFLAQVANNVPQFIPFLRKSMGYKDDGILELFGEIRLFGSTVVTDDADSMDLEVGAQIRYPGKLIIGFKVLNSTEIHVTDEHFKNKRNAATALVFVTIPFKEPNYVDQEFPTKEYDEKLKITKMSLFTKKFNEDTPIHFNTDERQQKSMESGIEAAAAWGRFIYEVMLSHTHGKNTPLDQDVSGYQNARIAVKYELNPRLRIVAEGIGDNYNRGHLQAGLGLELKPLVGTKAENFVNVSISGMYYPGSSYCTLSRCNQAQAYAPELDLHRNWGLLMDASKTFNIYKLTEWTGFKGEFALSNRVYMRNLDYGYFSVVINAGFVNEKLGIRVGASPYGQDCNIGAPAGKNVFAKPRQGKCGPHSEKVGAYLTLDVLRFSETFSKALSESYAKIFDKPSEKNQTTGLEKSQSALTTAEVTKNNLEVIANTKPAANKVDALPKLNLKSLPSMDRDYTPVYNWLSSIGQIWLSGDNSDEARDLYEAIPYLVKKITEKMLWTAKYTIKTESQSASRSNIQLETKAYFQILEDIRRIYDQNQSHRDLELVTDKRLESILRNTFSKNVRWQESIQSIGTDILSEATYCLGVVYTKSGNSSKGSELKSTSGYELPNWFSRNTVFSKSNFCLE